MNIEYFERNYKTIVVMLAVSSVLLSLFFLQFTVDDSYITFRFAKNFVENGVWNWNITGEKVEAYTSFLYAFLAIIPEGIGVNTPLFFKFLGATTILYLSVRLFGLIMEGKIIYLMALTFLLLNPFVYIHAYSALETPLFMVLLFEMVILISPLEGGISIKHEKIFLFILFILPTVRPEGALFSIIGLSLLFYKERTIKSKVFFLGISIVAMGYFVWRYQYFGYIFPNPFYIKTANGFSVNKMIKYFIGNVEFIGVSFFLLLLIKNKYFRILIGIAILLNIFIYGKSDLQMNYADRFPFQTLFPFFLASFVLVKNRNTSIVIFVLMVFMLGGIFSNKGRLRDLAIYYPVAIQSHAKLGVALSKYKNENLSLMVGDAGMIPYFSEWHAYDSIGLANAYVAHEGFSLDYIRNIKPDLIIMYSRTPDENGLTLESYNQKHIYSYITSSHKYSLVGSSKWRDYYIILFLKKDINKFNEIKQAISIIDNKTKDFKISKKAFFLQKYLIYP